MHVVFLVNIPPNNQKQHTGLLIKEIIKFNIVTNIEGTCIMWVLLTNCNNTKYRAIIVLIFHRTNNLNIIIIKSIYVRYVNPKGLDTCSSKVTLCMMLSVIIFRYVCFVNNQITSFVARIIIVLPQNQYWMMIYCWFNKRLYLCDKRSIRACVSVIKHYWTMYY